jgi:hypothetical protein
MKNMGEDLWAWVTEYPDGSVGMIGAMVPGMEHVPLITRNREAARQLERFARQHGENSGQRVWLRHYKVVEDIDG